MIERSPILRKRLREKLGEKDRLNAGVMIYLGSAAEARHDNLGLTVVSYGGKQPLLADSFRQVMVFDFVAKRAGHPTATGFDLDRAVPERSAEQRHGVLGTDKCLLMAVAVVRDVSGLRGTRQGFRVQVDGAGKKRFQEQGLFGHAPRRAGANELRVLIDEGQQATRLDADDRHAATGQASELCHVRLSKLTGLRE